LLKLNSSSLALIIGNLIPIIGVIFFSWELYPIVLLYWLENLVIGVLNIIKMLSCADGGLLLQKLFMSVFFVVHYGMFCFGHGTFVVELFGNDDASLNQVPLLILDSVLKWALLALILSHSFSMLSNYYMRGEYKKLSTKDVMFMPYKRIIVLHVFIIFGAMALQTFGVTQLGLIALAIVKILADLLSHKMEHRKTQV